MEHENPPSDDELSQALDAIRPEIEAYRQREIDSIHPSTAYRAAMQRSLVELVREDVSRCHARDSIVHQWLTHLRGFGATWRELMEAVPLFRWAHQGAWALGLGLLLAFSWHIATDQAALAAAMTEHEEVEQWLPGDASFGEPHAAEQEPHSTLEAQRQAEKLPDSLKNQPSQTTGR